jgi:hypothetical protein
MSKKENEIEKLELVTQKTLDAYRSKIHIAIIRKCELVQKFYGNKSIGVSHMLPEDFAHTTAFAQGGFSGSVTLVFRNGAFGFDGVVMGQEFSAFKNNTGSNLSTTRNLDCLEGAEEALAFYLMLKAVTEAVSGVGRECGKVEKKKREEALKEKQELEQKDRRQALAFYDAAIVLAAESVG